jgi:hypothetical protein
MKKVKTDIVLDVDEMSDPMISWFLNMLEKAYVDDIEYEPIPLSDKGKYEVFFVIHDDAPHGLITIENIEADTIQTDSKYEGKRSVFKAERNLKMKQCKKFKKSVEERVKIKLGEL